MITMPGGGVAQVYTYVSLNTVGTGALGSTVSGLLVVGVTACSTVRPIVGGGAVGGGGVVPPGTVDPVVAMVVVVVVVVVLGAGNPCWNGIVPDTKVAMQSVPGT